MLPLLQMGPFAVRVPGLILLVGIWVGLHLADRAAPRRGIPTEHIDGLVFTGLVAGLVGARIWYVVRYLDAYVGDPLAMISLNPATLAVWEGAATGAVAAWVYGQRKGLPFWETLDAPAPGLAVFMAFLSLANLASGNAFGAPADVPWAIELWGQARHPTQLYNLAVSLAVLGAVWRLGRVKTFPGFLGLTWLLLASSSQLFLEAFRGDSTIVLGVLRQGQLISMLLVTTSLIGLHLLAVRAEGRS